MHVETTRRVLRSCQFLQLLLITTLWKRWLHETNNLGIGEIFDSKHPRGHWSDRLCFLSVNNNTHNNLDIWNACFLERHATRISACHGMVGFGVHEKCFDWHILHRSIGQLHTGRFTILYTWCMPLPSALTSMEFLGKRIRRRHETSAVSIDTYFLGFGVRAVVGSLRDSGTVSSTINGGLRKMVERMRQGLLCTRFPLRWLKLGVTPGHVLRWPIWDTRQRVCSRLLTYAKYWETSISVFCMFSNSSCVFRIVSNCGH